MLTLPVSPRLWPRPASNVLVFFFLFRQHVRVHLPSCVSGRNMTGVVVLDDVLYESDSLTVGQLDSQTLTHFTLNARVVTVPVMWMRMDLEIFC